MTKKCFVEYIWDQLCLCKIDTNLHLQNLLLKMLVNSLWLKNLNNMLKINVKNLLMKENHFISIFKYYHRSLKQVYCIIITKISDIKLDLML